MKRRLSLTARLTLLFAVMSALLLLCFAALIATAIERHFVVLDREELEGKLRLVRNEIERIHTREQLSALPARLRDALVGHPNLLLAVGGPDGAVLLASGAAPLPAGFLKQPGFFEWRHGALLFRGLTGIMTVQAPRAMPIAVSVALDTAQHAHFLHSLQTLLLAFVLGATLLSGLLGWLIARKGLAPLRLMKDQAATVTPRKLNLRLSVESVPVEMADLAVALNAMLERLEQAFERLSAFSSDLAHELRTPISNLMMQTQVALSQSRSPEDYRDILASNEEEFERLSRMISDMLFLAKADHGLMLPSREAIDLGAEIQALFDYYDALAEERRVSLVCTGTATLMGDRLMIRRALSNLLSNALRHTPAGGRIGVTVGASPAGTTLSVENPGEPIDPAQLPRLFERFFRADSARLHDDSLGAGLGLAIVKAIVTAHGGAVSVTSDRRGTRFTLSFLDAARDAEPQALEDKVPGQEPRGLRECNSAVSVLSGTAGHTGSPL